VTRRVKAVSYPLFRDIQGGSSEAYNLESRRGRWVNVFARLKPGVTVERAQASLQPYFRLLIHREAFARRYFSGRSAVGRHFGFDDGPAAAPDV
jgi:hypothetical protein